MKRILIINFLLLISSPSFCQSNNRSNLVAKAKSRFAWLKNIDESSNPVIAIARCK